MFNNKIDGNAEVNFQSVIKIGPSIELLRRQSKDNASANGGDSWLEWFKATMLTLPKSEDVVKEFIDKMGETLQLIKNFDILSDKHDSFDEREFGSLFRNFDRNMSNAKAYLPIY